MGVGIAAFGVRFLLSLLANGRADFSFQADVDWRILVFTVGVTLATGLLFGLAPAIAATRGAFPLRA